MHTTFNEQYNKMVTKIVLMNELSIGTLGPESTSSYQALRYFINSLSKQKKLKYEEKLYDTFNECYDEILEGKIDLALVPSAYGDITRFFWNPNLTNIYTLPFPTPEYGIVSKTGYMLSKNRKVRVASCEPVRFLLDVLLSGDDITQHEYSTLITPSTTKALEAMLHNKADIAITNKTSYQKYASTQNIEFITDCFNTQMIWCVFCRKDFLDSY